MYPAANRNPFAFVAAGLVLLIVACEVHGQSKKTPAASGAATGWPQFLGPDRNGISQETGLIAACSPIVVSKRPKTRGLPTRKLNTMIARASDKTARN